MHPNFYHWHTRAELKPETGSLEPRWNAAAAFAEKLSAADIRSLLLLVLFPGAEPTFAKQYTEALVKSEPTFPLDKNAELLRVMATASVYSEMEKSSNAADALALGLQAADFPKGRVEPVCQDVMARAAEYLNAESERVRPRIYAGTLANAEKQAEVHFGKLKKAVEVNTVEELGKSVEAVGRGILAAIKESHQQLGEVIGRLAEESQFLWWLVGHLSPARMVRREQLTAESYSLTAALEAAERVALLPPAGSVESILDEALAQCSKGGRASKLLTELIAVADLDRVHSATDAQPAPELTPITALLAARAKAGNLEPESLKKLHISPKMKITPVEASRQYFRELMFLRALEEVD
ncbi:MAG: GTPase-associated system all-helical protein GASH [Deltaproteobacteria bacterium]|nr:GTPase-associated system all-helical protein GASH [Deltaproteobacteria bacterium]